MPITHVNAKGKTYYLHQGTTKTGKPKYHFAMKREGTLADRIPEGFEIYENPNAQVFLRRIPPKIITDEERQIVEDGMETPQNYAHEGERLWNEEAGRTWVAHIDQIEALIAPLSTISLERALPREGEVVLDVGCGGGATSRHMAERVGSQGRVVGVDISSPLLAVARERSGHLSNLRFELDDAQTMDLGADVFDLIYSRFGVMFFQNVIAAFTNLHRGLKPTGRLIFLCWRAGAENPWMRQPATVIQALFPPPPNSNLDVPDPDAPGPFSLSQSERLYHVLQSAGFTDMKVEALGAHMPMGSADEAMSFILGMMGPPADRMSLATYEQVIELHDSIRKIVAQYDTADGVSIPCAAWMVSARA